MVLSARRLNYALKTVSQGAAARIIGVSQSTISRWSRGISAPLKSAFTTIRNMYQKEAYNTLRGVGAPIHQARRFSAYAPESARLKEGIYKTMADDFTIQMFADWSIKDNFAVTRESIDRGFATIRERVLEGMRKSRKTYEDFEKYLVLETKID